MAAELQVNPSTIVRFAYRLGLNGYPDLQERMREVVRGELSRAGDSGGTVGMDAETSLGVSLNQDWRNLNRTIAGLSAADLKRAVETLNQKTHQIAGSTRFFGGHRHCGC